MYEDQIIMTQMLTDTSSPPLITFDILNPDTQCNNSPVIPRESHKDPSSNHQ